MALLWMDSFDHYVTADITEKWSTIAQTLHLTPTIQATAGRRASGAFRLTETNGGSGASAAALHRTLAPADATGCMGFAISVPAGMIAGAGPGVQIASFREGGSPQVTLRMNPAGTLSVLRGTQGGTVLGTSTATLVLGGFSYLEWKVVIHLSAGTVDVRLNGASILSLTGQNTRNTATAAWTEAALGCSDSVLGCWAMSGARSMDFDDVYVLDGSGAAPWNTFLGDVRVDPRTATAAGATTGWTPSTGANWQNVDDTTPDDDTTYNSTSTLNAIDTFVVQDAPVVGATIFGVQHCLSLKKMDAGTCTVAPVVRHSGTDYVGANLSPSTNYAFGLLVQQTNPGTAAQWTEAGFNAAEFGYKRTT